MLSKNHRLWSLIIGFSGFIGVAAGAAGAHIVHDPTLAVLVEKAAFYQLIHTVALMFMSGETSRAARHVCLCWCVGIVLFCGSLYVKGFALSASAPLAPFGGTLLMAGWLMLPFSAFTRKQ